MNARFAQFVFTLVVCSTLVSLPMASAEEVAQGQGDHATTTAASDAGQGHEVNSAGTGSGDHTKQGADQHAAEHDDHAKFERPPIYLSPQLLVFTVVLFGLYFFAMKGTAWQPLIAGLNEREARVARAEQDAAKAKAEAIRFHEQAEKRMVEAHNQVKEILAKARAEAESQKLQIVSDAEREATRVKEEALSQITVARQQAIEELSRMVEGQAVLATSRIAGRSFN